MPPPCPPGPPPAEAEDAPLRRVAEGRYRDFLAVGAGGMGVVYRAFDAELGRDVAFKVMRPDAGSGASGITPPTPPGLAGSARVSDPAALASRRARFLSEARLTAHLEHPGIPAVHEIGVTAEGLPYYTMQLVAGGDTLATRLDACRGLSWAARAPLLEPFARLCEAVAYAHGRGIVHRDLKPENVAVGAFDEVVVLDWGLGSPAAAGAAVEGGPPGVDPGRPADPRRTQAPGLGTPGHIPPEALAAVVPADPRADVFALGSILFEILTGRPPWTRSSHQAYAAAVAAAPAPAAQGLEPGAPTALAELARRALERDPALRPAHAGELARALGAWQARAAADREAQGLAEQAWALLGPAGEAPAPAGADLLDRAALAARRALELAPGLPRAQAALHAVDGARAAALARHAAQARRRALGRVGLAALAAGALVAVGVAAALERRRREAQEARERTEVEHERAETLVGFMLSDLRQALEPLGRLDLLAAVARQAQAHYERGPQEPGGADERRRRAAALALVGDVLRSQGDLPGALTAHRAAVAEAQAGLEARPDDARARLEAAVQRRRVAEVRELQGHRLEALAAFREHLEELGRLPADVAASPAGVRARARAHALLGVAQVRQREAASGKDHVERGVALLEGLAAAPGADDGDVDAWLEARVRRAALGAADDPARAVAEGRAVLALAQERGREAPDPARWRVRALETRLALLAPLAASGDGPGAEAAYREAREALEGLRRGDPSNGRWGELSAQLEGRMADLRLGGREPAAALEHVERGLGTAEGLVATDPSNAHRLHLLVDLSDRGARALAALRDPRLLAMRERNVAASRRLHERDPECVAWRLILGFNTRRLADLLDVERRVPEALAAYDAAHALLARLAREQPDDRVLAVDAAACEVGAGRMRAALGEREAGLSRMRAGLEATQAAARRWPEDLEIPATLPTLLEQCALALGAGSADAAPQARELLERAAGLLAQPDLSGWVPPHWPEARLRVARRLADLPR